MVCTEFVEFDVAPPESVIPMVLMLKAPAAFGVKVIKATSSTAVRARDALAPFTAPEMARVVRRTVIVFPVAEERVTADVAFEVEPNATTVSAAVSFTESVEVAILKT